MVGGNCDHRPRLRKCFSAEIPDPFDHAEQMLRTEERSANGGRISSAGATLQILCKFRRKLLANFREAGATRFPGPQSST